MYSLQGYCLYCKLKKIIIQSWLSFIGSLSPLKSILSQTPLLSAQISQMQRPSFLRADPPSVFCWLSGCLRGEEVEPFPFLPGICQRTRLLVLVRTNILRVFVT